MTFEERKEYMNNILYHLDFVNDMDAAYCEGEEQYLVNSVMAITNVGPRLWERKTGNRQQCYSNMFSKLLLAYLLSEIKEGNLLSVSFLDRLKGMEVDNFENFYYDDCGYGTSEALTWIVKGMITEKGYYSIDVDEVDTMEACEAEYRHGESSGLLARAMLESCPKLEEYMTLSELSDKMEDTMICWPATLNYEFELEIETISSSILYEITKKEEKYPTELGQMIIGKSDVIFRIILQSDYMYDILSWKIMDDIERKVLYISTTCSDLYGDEVETYPFVMQRLHRYNYRNLFQIVELNKLIGEYQALYL